MIIRVEADHRLRVEEPTNFRKFKVACDLPEARFAEVAGANPGAVTFDDATTAWVSIAALRDWEGLKDDTSWQNGLSAMIKAAEPHGWISAEKQAIKAHVEWIG